MTEATRKYPFYFFAIMMACFSGFSCSTNKDDLFLEDRAEILTPQEQQRIVDFNKVLLSDLDIHFKLIILDKKADNINNLATDIFGHLGEQTRGAKGLLFLIDPIGEQVRIEVGYDLEAIFSDGFVGYLENKQMAPFFQIGKIGAGVEATTELFVARMQRALEGSEFDASQEFGLLEHYSGGGGAQMNVGINTQPLENKNSSSRRPALQSQSSPEGTLEAYKQVLRAHEKDSNLSLFTPKTREFFSQWVVTDAQQNNELRAIEKTTPDRVIISGDFAVIRYPISQRTQTPYFLQKGKQGWMLDFWCMNQVIRMNHKNMWMLKSLDHPYMFAFKDWQFDKNGFPTGIK